MSDTNEPAPWWGFANRGIIGLPPEPWTDGNEWPTEGYDGALRGFDWDADGTFAQSQRTREEWLALTDEMLRRWAAFRAHVVALPDDPPSETR